jgi:hypothetical protein
VAAGASHKYGIVSRNVRVSSYVGWINQVIYEFENGSEPVKGLLAHWDFDDISEGFAQDMSGVGHRGNIVRAKAAEGISRGAVEFGVSREIWNGSSAEYVEVPNRTSSLNGLLANDLKIRKDVTIAAWLYSESTNPGWSEKKDADALTVLAKSPLSRKTRDFALSVGHGYFRLDGGSGRFARSSVHAVPYRRWAHIAVTRAANVVRFYSNGNFIGQDRLPGDFPATDNPVLIGYLPEAGLTFSGKIDDLRFYNRSLSELEIKSLATKHLR